MPLKNWYVKTYQVFKNINHKLVNSHIYYLMCVDILRRNTAGIMMLFRCRICVKLKQVQCIHSGGN